MTLNTTKHAACFVFPILRIYAEGDIAKSANGVHSEFSAGALLCHESGGNVGKISVMIGDALSMSPTLSIVRQLVRNTQLFKCHETIF